MGNTDTKSDNMELVKTCVALYPMCGWCRQPYKEEAHHSFTVLLLWDNFADSWCQSIDILIYGYIIWSFYKALFYK